MQTIHRLNADVPFYAGKFYDEESGHYYLRARYYDPVTARFISRDTYMGTLDNPLSHNLYTYCSNNPLIYVDPSGHNEVSTLLPGNYADELNKLMFILTDWSDKAFAVEGKFWRKCLQCKWRSRRWSLLGVGFNEFGKW